MRRGVGSRVCRASADGDAHGHTSPITPRIQAAEEAARVTDSPALSVPIAEPWEPLHSAAQSRREPATAHGTIHRSHSQSSALRTKQGRWLGCCSRPGRKRASRANRLARPCRSPSSRSPDSRAASQESTHSSSSPSTRWKRAQRGLGQIEAAGTDDGACPEWYKATGRMDSCFGATHRTERALTPNPLHTLRLPNRDDIHGPSAETGISE